MSRQTSPTVIGAFVIGGTVLLAVAIAIFGGAELLARKTMLVTYFDGSVNGLRVGSNVAFRGVRVGFVENITLLTDVETLTPKIEVVMQLVPEAIRVLQDGRPVDQPLDSVVTIKDLVAAGFTAQLESESFVTGQLFVELDFRPQAPQSLYGNNAPYPEVPSVPSEIQQAIARFETIVADLQRNVDFAAFSQRLFSILEGLDELVNSQDLRTTLAGISTLINAEDTQQLSTSLRELLAELHGVVAQARQLVANVDGEFGGLMARAEPAMETFDEVLAEAQRMLGAAADQLEGRSVEAGQLQSTMTEVDAAARSLRRFFDYLERHPEALLRGKQD